MERREALGWLLAGASVPLLRGLGPVELVAVGQHVHASVATASSDPPLEVLDARNSRLVVAAAERILPETDTPGATAARVNQFVDRLLAHWYPPADRDRFLAGLSVLERLGLERHGSSFADCTEAEQVAILTAFDDEVIALRRAAGARPGPPGRPSAPTPDEHWFAMLKFMTIWGFYTSEVGVTEELRHDLVPGYYDGCAPVATARRGGA